MYVIEHIFLLQTFSLTIWYYHPFLVYNCFLCYINHYITNYLTWYLLYYTVYYIYYMYNI